MVEYENPYSAPSVAPTAPVPRSGGNMIGQVRIVAILMVVQGVLEALFGIYFLVMSFVMPALMAQNPNQMPDAQFEMMNSFMVIYFGIGGGVALLVGMLRIVAGIMGFSFRGRMLGIVSHFSGIAMAVTFYCLPTAIAICVYGCIVYFNRDVANAFQMKKNGSSYEEILKYYGK